jgi:hypothetical protein
MRRKTKCQDEHIDFVMEALDNGISIKNHKKIVKYVNDCCKHFGWTEKEYIFTEDMVSGAIGMAKLIRYDETWEGEPFDNKWYKIPGKPKTDTRKPSIPEIYEDIYTTIKEAMKNGLNEDKAIFEFVKSKSKHKQMIDQELINQIIYNIIDEAGQWI